MRARLSAHMPVSVTIRIGIDRAASSARRMLGELPELLMAIEQIARAREAR